MGCVSFDRKLSDILPKLEKKRTSKAVFEEITLKHCPFANAIYNSPKYFCCRHDYVVFTRSLGEKLFCVCARIKCILSLFFASFIMLQKIC